MSIFIANLAFGDQGLLMAAKLGVLLASATAGMLGLVMGRYYIKSQWRGESPGGGR
jgi:NhaA family Na+:H+ antiporter